MRIMRIVNVIPNDHSNEINPDAEPSIAVNPSNVDEMIITAFTPEEVGNPNAPLFFSTDGGENWSLRFDIPGGETHDQSPSFAKTSAILYISTIAGNGDFNVLRTSDPNTAADVIKSDDPVDQPWAEATTVIGGSDDGLDRLYVGYNDDETPRTAKVEVYLDAATAANPAFTKVTLDHRTPNPRNGYEIRPVTHPDGTVYVAFKTRKSEAFPDSVNDIVVVRDDNWGTGSSPFTALKDPDDDKVGSRVVRDVFITEAQPLGGIRLNNDLNIAIDPTNSSVVYITWCDNAGPTYTLRVRRSVNRGRNWSDDLLVVENAALATMTINARGKVGLFYQQLVAGQMETHFRSTIDGTNWDDTLLARTAPTNDFTGDYARMVAIGSDFYGVFPAMNTPNPTNFFPNGGGTFRYQRNTNGNSLVGTDNVTVINPSVDPFFFKVQERDLVVVTDRNTYSKDEVDALLFQQTPNSIPAAFFVVVDGFRASDLNITNTTLSGTPNVAPVPTFTPGLVGITAQATACTAEDPDHLGIPQRFTWTYQVTFANSNDFNQEIRQVTLTASVTSNAGITVSGQAVVTLTTQPNPYETDGPTSWLSVDLQVFKLRLGQSLPHTPGIVLGGDPIDFITRLLANTGGGYNDPSLPRAPSHPYDIDLVAHQDSSTVTIARTEGFFLPVFNFAVARVRYRALTTPAPNVRAFFRLFQCATTSTDFQPTTTYLTGGQGGTRIPLLGVVNDEVVVIPCFAARRVDPANPLGLSAQTDPINVGPLGQAIPPDATGNEVQVYFGCWLDINQTTHVLPAGGQTGATPYTPTRSVQDAIRGQHQCLVAEINLDPPAPQIGAGVGPANSDKLAQRNLTIVGVGSPHQVPATFDIKPTFASLGTRETPDELMIDWGSLPAGSRASIFLPGTSADAILETANKLYLRHGLARADAQTLTCAARGITYVPIPPGIGSNYAGLLTVDVPPTVKKGQAHKVVARQLRNIAAKRPVPPPVILATTAAAIIVKDLIHWRRVVGTFQVTIPVGNKAELLAIEERLLSVLRWIFKRMPLTDRWYPVFQRYLDVVGGRVTDLGGDPDAIQPSPDGDGGAAPPKDGDDERVCITGKIAGLIFDRFGDFEGFILDTERGERKLFSREKHIAQLAERAWRERLRITVCATRRTPQRPEYIVIHQPPVPFTG